MKPLAYVANPDDKSFYDKNYSQIHRHKNAGAYLYGFGHGQARLVYVIAYAPNEEAGYDQALAFLADVQEKQELGIIEEKIYALSKGQDLASELGVKAKDPKLPDLIFEHYDLVDGYDYWLSKEEFLYVKGPLAPKALLKELNIIYKRFPENVRQIKTSRTRN